MVSLEELCVHFAGSLFWFGEVCTVLPLHGAVALSSVLDQRYLLVGNSGHKTKSSKFLLNKDENPEKYVLLAIDYQSLWCFAKGLLSGFKFMQHRINYY